MDWKTVCENLIQNIVHGNFRCTKRVTAWFLVCLHASLHYYVQKNLDWIFFYTIIYERWRENNKFRCNAMSLYTWDGCCDHCYFSDIHFLLLFPTVSICRHKLSKRQLYKCITTTHIVSQANHSKIMSPIYRKVVTPCLLIARLTF